MAQTLGATARQLLTNIVERMYFPVPTSQNTSTLLSEGMFKVADLSIAAAGTTVSWTVTAGSHGDFTTGMNYFAAFVNLKTYSGATEVQCYIEAADNAAMTTNLRRVAFKIAPAAAGPWTVVLFGACPDGAKQFARVVFVTGTGATATADLILMGFQ
jgi:hypothetical protein